MEDKKKIFVEKIGVKTEKMGYSPIAGRIVGTLLLAEPPYMTFEELCESLSASKSTISTNLNFLMSNEKGIIEYFTLPGDRKRYFKISHENWLNHICNIPDEIETGTHLLKDILKYRVENNLDPEFTKGCEKVFSFHLFLSEKIVELADEWKAKYLEK